MRLELKAFLEASGQLRQPFALEGHLRKRHPLVQHLCLVGSLAGCAGARQGGTGVLRVERDLIHVLVEHAHYHGINGLEAVED